MLRICRVNSFIQFSEVEFLRAAFGPSPVIRQALEELKKKSPKECSIHYHLALCYYREYPTKSLESLNIINTALEAKRRDRARSANSVSGASLSSSDSARTPDTLVSGQASDDQLAAKALLMASQISAAAVLRPMMNFSSTVEFMNSMMASRAPTPGRFSTDQANASLLFLRTAASLDPKNVSILNAIGILSFNLSKFSEAADIFAEVYQQSGCTYLDPLVNRGVALLFLNQHEEAAECFQEALVKDPQHLEATVNYCVILFKNKRYDDAVDVLEKACALYRAEAMLWNNLGVAYASVGLPMEAQTCFNQVAQLRASSASAGAFFASSPSSLRCDSRIECNIGVSLCAERDLLQAHSQLMRSLEADSQNKFAWTSIAKVFDLSLNEAESEKDQALPDDENLFNKCLHSISQSFCIEKSDPTTWNALGVIYLRKGYFKEATEALRNAITKDPTSGAFWANYTLSLHLKLQHFKSSLADPTPDEAAEIDGLKSALLQLTTKFSDNFTALNNAGNIFRELGQLDDALRTFESALSIFPKNAALLNNIALVHLSKGEVPEAMRLFAEAAAVDRFLQASSTNLKILQTL
eukprot:TRINITY_DN239_c0_g1_i12.p1 TRINITY_DN239_c0_g1~~TRINITY_DN239_c0_g1_i12.p1  ORF type:complete len:584 (+),score=76.44 TRINITY_DN239_c0_g1_i12:112-1863(+)